MNKITDTGYQLPVAEALRTFDLFTTGTTLPLAVWAVETSTAQRGQYVVKMKRSDRMTTTSSAFELIAGWMAMELELPAAVPALVNLSTDFVETAMKGRDGYRTARQSLGINFATIYQPGFDKIPAVAFSLPDGFIEIAQLIYVFDLFIANTDRGHQKDNIASNGSKLLIYDHELAFSFVRVLPFLRNQTPWILNDADQDLYKMHFFYKMFRELKPDFAKQVAMLQRFDTKFWSKVHNLLPGEWIDEQVMAIAPYLTSIVENHADFTQSLNKTVAL